MPEIFVIRLPYSTSRTNLDKIAADKIIRQDNLSYTRLLFDLGDKTGYPDLTVSPPNNTSVNNLVTNAYAGLIKVTATQQLTYGGGGLDFSAATAAGQFVQFEDILQDIYSNFNSQSQNFLVFLYCKLPTSSDWNANAAIQPFFDCGAAYNAAPDLLNISLTNSSIISLRRQSGTGSTIDTITLAPQAADYGSLAQIAFWRSSPGQLARMRTSAGIRWGSGTIGGTAFSGGTLALRGTDNPQDFSTRIVRIGWGGGSFGSNTQPNGMNGFKLYRGGILNLSRVNSSFNVISFLDDDWSGVISRGLFS